MIVLFAVQLIAVTLLASERAGIGYALWDSFLFIFIDTLSLSPRIGSLLGVTQVAAPAAQTAVAIMGFWVVALCTAFFSSVSERELRRSKAEMAALAEMASELEHVTGEDEIIAILLRTLVTAFPFRRGALWWSQGSRPAGMILGAPAMPVECIPVPGLAHEDQIAGEAWQRREPLLLRQLNEESDRAASSLLPGATNVVVLPLQVDGIDSGIILLEHGGSPLSARIPRPTLVMLSQSVSHAALAVRNARLLAERSRLAALDGLTGLANRREFDTVLSREVDRSLRTGDPLSLVVFDVDHFKAVNDTRGHLAGDEVLRSIAAVMSMSMREMDLVARYGGEEFAAVLPRCGSHDAVRVVDRITAGIREHPGLVGVTVSAGIATVPVNALAALDLIGAADEAMFVSKRGGRNRYTISDAEANSTRARENSRPG